MPGYPSQAIMVDDSYGIQFPSLRARALSKPKKRKIYRPIIANLSDTQYPVVYQVCEYLDWLVEVGEGRQWDMKWMDGAVSIDFLSHMHYHQKVNHFPGMSVLSRKNNLSKNLARMRQAFPEQYNFSPRTFLLPQDAVRLKNYAKYSRQKNIIQSYIVKPYAACQGRGIFITQNIGCNTRIYLEIEMQSHSVVQKYLVSPLLYKGLKFDFRIYVLVTGCDPLRVYIYNEGLVRFATEKYEPPDDNNIDNLCMHLTNYAINKENPKYVFNTSLENLSHGHKKSLAEFFQTLKNFDLPAHDYWSQIKDQIVKTLIAGQSHLMHEYRMAQPHNFANDMCFQILGFDFMIDAKNKCYLLEVNHTPSFTAETPLDELVKANLIRDTLVLVKITSHARANAIARAELEQNRRIFTGKSLKVTPEERQKIMAMFQAERDNFERSHLGSFERIFPSKNPMRQATYEEMLAFSLYDYKSSSAGMIIGYHRRSVSPYFPNRLATSTSCDDEDDDEGGKYEVKESERTNAQLIEIKASFLSYSPYNNKFAQKKNNLYLAPILSSKDERLGARAYDSVVPKKEYYTMFNKNLRVRRLPI